MESDDKVNPNMYPNLYKFMNRYERIIMNQKNGRRLKDEFGFN